VEVVDGHRDRVHFLDELGAEGLLEGAGARAGDEGADFSAVDVLERVADGDEELETFSACRVSWPLVVGPEDFLGAGSMTTAFTGGGADVDADRTMESPVSGPGTEGGGRVPTFSSSRVFCQGRSFCPALEIPFRPFGDCVGIFDFSRLTM
jgi:hypothetical protein